MNLVVIAKRALTSSLASLVILSIVVGLVAVPETAFAQGTQGPDTAPPNSTREFMLSATYGALAGALVGGASLAFSDRPGDNLNKVARGASLGLYAGILLGLYVVYGSRGGSDYDDEAARYQEPKLLVAPVVTERGLEGAEARYSVLNF